MWCWFDLLSCYFPQWFSAIPLGAVTVVRTWLILMTSILNEMIAETSWCFILEWKSGNNIALFYVSHIRNQNFIAVMLLCSEVLAIKQGDAMAPWSIFQFGLNHLYSEYFFFGSQDFMGIFFSEISFQQMVVRLWGSAIVPRGVIPEPILQPQN